MLKMGAPHCIVCNVPAIAHGHLLNSKNLGAYKPVLCNSAPRKHQCYFLRGGFEGGHAVKTVEVAVRSVRTETETGESVAFKEEGFAVKVLKGSPLPFGATARDGGVNFAVHSSRATSVTICFFTLSDLHKGKVTKKIPLDPLLNKTGDVWHTFLAGKFDGTLYGYQVDGEYCPEEGHRYDQSCILLDPYARAIISREQYGVLGPGGNCWPQMAGMVPVPDDEFDWQGDLPLKLPQKDLFIYEMHVRGFTRHGSSNVNHPGTYLGLVEKLEHLKELGVNAIELMPCQEFNELEYYSYNSVMGDYKMNFWGYSTINYFSPMIRYAASGVRNCGHDAIKEFKTFVREAHKHGIEVFMDVVFNHTAEGNDMGPTLSFRGLDNSMYYMLAPQGEFYNYSGCGNTFNCNHPIVRRFIVDCLRCPRTDDPWLTLLYPYFAMENSEHGLDNLEERKGLSRENKYWVIEMHIDGFRFDLASIMTRASSLWNGENVFGNDIEGDFLTTGTPLNEPPLIDMISNDPVLRGVKLIAEAWDTGGLYQVGNFPHWGIWSEWNGQYRDVTRQFIKGTDGLAGAFAQCLCGSPHLYQKGGRRPWHSVNFVCAHDGFSLADLVSYNQKHNLANGEDNNDGDDHNNSWNCGEEGELVGLPVQRLRQRQMRNFIVCLMVSQGVPMLTMGDEYGHTKGGNNNTYCHDNNVNYFRWDKKVTSQAEFFKFCCLMAMFRRECESLGLEDFPTAERLQWHGHQPETPDWSESSRFVAFTMVDSKRIELYVAFNTSHLPVIITLPERPGFRWEPYVDTSKVPPYDFLADDLPNRAIVVKQYDHFLNAGVYPMLSYSSIILVLSVDRNI